MFLKGVNYDITGRQFGATAYAILAARKSANPLAKAIGIGSIMFFPVDFLMSAKFAKDNVEFCKKNYFA